MAFYIFFYNLTSFMAFNSIDRILFNKKILQILICSFLIRLLHYSFSFLDQSRVLSLLHGIRIKLLYYFQYKVFKVQHLTSKMNQDFATLNDLPENKVVRLDNHISSISAFCQVQGANFEFTGYDSGTRYLKKKYGIPKEINKYFARRNFFFSRFEEGIQLDEESWYSVIPEPVSIYLGKRLKQAKIQKVFQPFCGVGGIAIHIADQFQQYIINDIDKNKIKMLKHNLKIYQKTPESLSYFCTDFLQIEPFQTDAMIICPPWGGIDLTEYSYRDLDQIMHPKLSDILNHGLKFSKNIMLQMPKNTNIENLLKVFIECNITPIFTIEKIMTNDKVSQLFIYIGDEKFTRMRNSQLYLEIYSGLKIEDKEEKKQIKKKLKQDSFDILKSIYAHSNPRKNKHLFF